MSSKRQSLLIGGLISSAGMFFAKAIGVLYAIPFNSIMGTTTNINLYGFAYQIYNYLLNIALAGFPFAVSALVAKYSTLHHYNTVLLVRKLSHSMMMMAGFIMMILLIAFSGVLAPLMTKIGVEDMQKVLIILSLALFFVPILSSIRGFYQGLKDMEVYAASQVLEQVGRVAFLLGASAISIYVLNMDRVWAVYFGVLSTSVAAVLAIMHLKLYDRKVMPDIRKKAKASDDHIEKRAIVKELSIVAMPYLLVAILGYSDNLINSLFVTNGFIANGMDAAQAEIYTQSINYGTLKLTAIPLILAPGFSAAILPMITSYMTKKDYKKVSRSICECVETVMYIGTPICLCLFLYAGPLYETLFPPEKGLEICTYVLKWYSVQVFFAIFGPIFTSIVMSVGMRNLKMKFEILITIIKFIITYPMICIWGFEGLVIASILIYLLSIVIDYYLLTKHVHVKWKYTWRRFLLILLSLIPMVLVFYLFQWVGIDAMGHGKLLNFLQMAFSGIFVVLAYFGVTYFFGLPQLIFHIDLNGLKAKIKNKR